MGRTRCGCSPSYPQRLLHHYGPFAQLVFYDRHCRPPRPSKNCENNKRPKVIKKVDASARIILVFWSLLVIVGFMSAFIALQDRTPTSKCILVVRTYGERSLSVIIPLRLCYRRHYYDPLYLATLYIILTNKST